jgi:hypothetical protein
MLVPLQQGQSLLSFPHIRSSIHFKQGQSVVEIQPPSLEQTVSSYLQQGIATPSLIGGVALRHWHPALLPVLT